MMYGLQCGFPSYADDMSRLSFLKHGMDIMMNICFKNSIIERYLYHYIKTNVMITNEPKQKYQERSRTWSLDGNTILETESYTHLGVVCDKYMSRRQL